MWRKFKQSADGFLLMEALLSLMILMTITLMILPTMLENISRKKQMESKTDLYRVLYEASKNWVETSRQTIWEFRDEKYNVIYQPTTITVINQEGEKVEVSK